MSAPDRQRPDCDARGSRMPPTPPPARLSFAAGGAFETLLQAFPFPLVVLARSGHVRLWNRACELLSGWTAAEVLGGPVPGLSETERRDLHDAVAHAMDETPWPAVECRMATKAGDAIPVRLSAAALHGDGEDVVAALIVPADVAARRPPNAARSRIDALRAVTTDVTRELNLQTLYGLITRRIGDLLGVTCGTVFLWDEASQSLLLKDGYGAGASTAPPQRRGEGLVGAVAERLQGVYTNEYPRSPYAMPPLAGQADLTAAIAAPLVYHDRLLGVLAFGSRDAGRVFSDDDLDVLRLLADHAAIAIENARLYTEEKQALEQLRRAQDELIRSEKLRTLGQMSAGLAHDLNNVLGAILGQIDLLRLQASDATPSDTLTLLENAAADGAAVVRRLQNFARQSRSPDLVPLDLAPLVWDTIEITRPRWRDEPQRAGRAIKLETALPAGLPRILGSAGEIREALTNLIFNAVDAMPLGGRLRLVARAVSASAAPTAETSPSAPSACPSTGHDGATWVELDVSDTGVGITDEVRQKVFDPFFTTKGAHGTGLGLSLVYGIMERHGGRIEVKSEPGRGATFTLRFRCAAAGNHGRSPAEMLAASAAHRVLVIDDEPMVRQTLVALLRAAKHTVVEAADGTEGLARLDQTPVDIVLTDLGMPDLTGWQVASAVKARHPSVPVVLLTGWDETVDGNDAAGVDRILKKPTRLDELLQVLSDLLPHPPQK